jgi:hypothetical protein
MSKKISSQLRKSKAPARKPERSSKARRRVRSSNSSSVLPRLKIAERTARNPDKAATVRPGTKQARVIAMLRAPAGATIDTISVAVGWQPHSVRGLLAGVIKKKLSLNLVSARSDKGRVYRVAGGEREEPVAAVKVN